MKSGFRFICSISLLAFLVWGCRKIEDPAPEHCFPEDIGEILVTNCATTGCHDDNSFAQEGRLSLTTWENMFQGSRAGAAVIPYRVDQSYLLFFMNTDSTLGITQTPVMPLNQDPLSREDYLKVQDWIAAGAPDCAGNIKWSDDPGRGKIYVSNQGCDQVAVLDRETRLVMSYVDIGRAEGLIESPHYLKVSPDGRYWYALYLSFNNSIEKYDANTDQFIGRVDIPDGNWNTMDMSPDGRFMFAVDYIDGIVVLADLENLSLVDQFTLGQGAHGSRISKDQQVLYVTNQEGNNLFKVTLDQDLRAQQVDFVDLVQDIPKPNPTRAVGPHEIIFSNDGSQYFVSCQYQGEVRAYQTDNDSLLTAITVGADPVEFDISQDFPYLIVPCMEDSTLNAGNELRRGSVAIINYNTLTLEKLLYTDYQPHGVAVDDEKGLVYISNRNANPSGPAPHHVTSCGGRNGTITAIDLNTLENLQGFRHELSVDPYAVAIRK
ncbi:MAG: cytochrome D1 domain-containing protein [Bacteroidota bacterium]